MFASDYNRAIDRQTKSNRELKILNHFRHTIKSKSSSTAGCDVSSLSNILDLITSAVFYHGYGTAERYA